MFVHINICVKNFGYGYFEEYIYVVFIYIYDKMETASTPATSIPCQNGIKNPPGELLDISSILKVVISTWFRLLKSMKS